MEIHIVIENPEPKLFFNELPVGALFYFEGNSQACMMKILARNPATGRIDYAFIHLSATTDEELADLQPKFVGKRFEDPQVAEHTYHSPVRRVFQTGTLDLSR